MSSTATVNSSKNVTPAKPPLGARIIKFIVKFWMYLLIEVIIFAAISSLFLSKHHDTKEQMQKTSWQENAANVQFLNTDGSEKTPE